MNKFQRAVWIAIALVGIVAVFDFFQYPRAFWLYSFALGAVASIVYYTFRKDKSEALAIFAAFVIMIMSGLEDLIFYLIRPLFQDYAFGIPATMDHLFVHPVIGRIAILMGQTTVTPIILLISVALGGITTYFVVKYLKTI